MVCIFSIFVLGDKSVRSSDQSCSVNCRFSTEMFRVLVSLDLITIGSVFDEIKELKMHTIGSWLLVSLTSILHMFWFTMILSIKVADTFVILVGLVIVGINPKSKLHWMKSFVVLCQSAFKKSRL